MILIPWEVLLSVLSPIKHNESSIQLFKKKPAFPAAHVHYLSMPPPHIWKFLYSLLLEGQSQTVKRSRWGRIYFPMHLQTPYHNFCLLACFFAHKIINLGTEQKQILLGKGKENKLSSFGGQAFVPIPPSLCTLAN